MSQNTHVSPVATRQSINSTPNLTPLKSKGLLAAQSLKTLNLKGHLMKFGKFGIHTTTLLAAALVASSSLADSGGGSGNGGGSDIDRVSKELVEFKKLGKVVRIDPRTFEGLYNELRPRLNAIDSKIPGLGKELEEAFDQRSWFVTDQKFTPRNSQEERPIEQDSNHVLINGEQVKAMNHEQLKRAWFHEIVRRLVQDKHAYIVTRTIVPNGMSWSTKSLSQEEIDQIVEDLTVVLYTESDLPARKLVKLVNEVVKNTSGKTFQDTRSGYISQPEIQDRIKEMGLKEKFEKICKSLPYPALNGTLEVRGPREYKLMPEMNDVSPEVKQTVLNRLNELKNETVRNDITPSYLSYLFSPLENGFHNGATPRNSTQTLDRWSNFSEEMSTAIEGRFQYDVDKVEDINDARRVEKALWACMEIRKSDLSIFSDSNDNENYANASAVRTLDEALAELKSVGVSIPFADPRLAKNTMKTKIDTSNPPSSTNQYQNAGIAN